jgi:hypothetical protein
VAVVLAVVAVILVGAGDESFVAHVRVDNQTPYDVAVDVAGATRDGWMGAGFAQRRTTTEFSDVVDQGATWVFRFSYAGVDAGEVTVARSTLEGAGWRVAVPASVVDRLVAAGVSPPP